MANSTETFFYGQGKVKLSVIAADGTLGPWRFIGDVSELKGSLEEKKVEHIESFSGKRSKIREFAISSSMTVNATLHDLNADNLVLFTQGTKTSIAAGTVTDEPLGTVAVGATISLKNINPSMVVITDSKASALTIPESHYTVDKFGNVAFISLPTAPSPTQPLKASYSFGAAEQVAIFSSNARPNVALRYEGINLAENGKPVLMELYKLSPSLLNELSMITTGDSVAGIEVTFGALLDSARPEGGAMGQFGRIVTA